MLIFTLFHFELHSLYLAGLWEPAQSPSCYTWQTLHKCRSSQTHVVAITYMYFTLNYTVFLFRVCPDPYFLYSSTNEKVWVITHQQWKEWIHLFIYQGKWSVFQLLMSSKVFQGILKLREKWSDGWDAFGTLMQIWEILMKSSLLCC